MPTSLETGELYGAEVSHLNSRPTPGESVPLKFQSDQQPELICPVWLEAMSQLDANGPTSGCWNAPSIGVSQWTSTSESVIVAPSSEPFVILDLERSSSVERSAEGMTEVTSDNAQMRRQVPKISLSTAFDNNDEDDDDNHDDKREMINEKPEVSSFSTVEAVEGRVCDPQPEEVEEKESKVIEKDEGRSERMARPPRRETGGEQVRKGRDEKDEFIRNVVGLIDEKQPAICVLEGRVSVGAKMTSRPAKKMTTTTTTTITQNSHSKCRARSSGERAAEISSGDKLESQQHSQLQLGRQMKRFSSAVCLSEGINQPSGGSSGEPATELGSKQVSKRSKQHSNRSRSPVVGHHQHQQTANSTSPSLGVKELATGSGQLDPLGPYDQMLRLARQRRPSVTNQGTLNVDQQALFAAVECGQLEKACSILEGAKVDVNSLNGDKLTCLDIAVLLRDAKMVRLLQLHGAKESSADIGYLERWSQLLALYMESRRLVEDLALSLNVMGGSNQQQQQLELVARQSRQDRASFCSSSSSPVFDLQIQEQPQLMLATGSLLSSALLEEKRRQLQYWRRRLELFMLMRYQFELLRVPGQPELVVIQVVGERSLGVKIVQPGRRSLVPVVATSGQENSHSKKLPLRRPLKLALTGTTLCTRGQSCSHWRLVSHFVRNTNRKKGVALESRSERNLAAFDRMIAQQLRLLSDQKTINDCAIGPAAGHELSGRNKRRRRRRLRQLLGRKGDVTSCGDQLMGVKQHFRRQSHLSSNPTKPSMAYELLVEAFRSERRVSWRRKRASCNDDDQEDQLTGRRGSNRSGCCETNGRGIDADHCGRRRCCCRHRAVDLESGFDRTAGSEDYEDNNMDEDDRDDDGDEEDEEEDEEDDDEDVLNCDYDFNDNEDDDQHENNNNNDNYNDNKKTPMRTKVINIRQDGRCPATSLGRGGRPIVTKYRVDWSREAKMEHLEGSLIVYATHRYPLQCRIDNLEPGCEYFVQVRAGNHRGFSEPTRTTPTCLTPSSWRQLADNGGHRKRQLDEQVFEKLTKLLLLNRNAPLLVCEQPEVAGSHQKSSDIGGGQGDHEKRRSINLMNLLIAEEESRWAPGMAGTGNGGAGVLADLGALPLDQNATAGAVTSSGVAVGVGSSSPESTSAQSSGGSATLRKNLINFFQSTSFKFNKLNNPNKRGLYLAAIVYHWPSSSSSTGGGRSGRRVVAKSTGSGQVDQRRLLVTNDDRLPVIEVLNELVSPGALMSDFYWLIKINGARWIDIKRLRQQLQKSHSSSTLHLKIKLLAAIEQMQAALNLQDLGRLFYKPVQAHDGSCVICTCRRVTDPKQVSSLSIKWTQQHKIIPSHLRKISRQFMISNCSNGPSMGQTSTGSAHSSTKPAATPTASVSSDSFNQAINNCGDSSSLVGRVHLSSGSLSTCDQCHLYTSGSFSQQQVPSSTSNFSSNSSLPSSSDGQPINQAVCTCHRTSQSSAHSHLVAQRAGSILATPTRSNSSLAAAASGLSTTTGSGPNQQNQSSAYLTMASLSPYELLLFHLDEIIHFERASPEPLERGLHLGFVQLQATVESMRLLVPRFRPNMVPCIRVRDNSHVSLAEWSRLKDFSGAIETGSGCQNPKSSTKGSRQVPKSTSSRLLPQQPAGRLSDPSIFVGQVDRRTGSGNQPNKLDDNFERARAKSVSRAQPSGSAISGNVSASSEQLAGSRSTSASLVPNSLDTRPTSGQSRSNVTRSDPDLMVAANGLITQNVGRLDRESPIGSNISSSSSVNRKWRHAHQDEGDTFARLLGEAARKLVDSLRAQLPQCVGGLDPTSGCQDDPTEQNSSHLQLSSILQALNKPSSNRIYDVELIELGPQLAVVLLIPTADQVCPVTSQDRSNLLQGNRHHMLLPLQMFETIHVGTYQPGLLANYSRLSAILETELIVAQHEHRQAFSSSELRATKSRLGQLQDVAAMADELWRQLRWIVDVVSFARDKSVASSQLAVRIGAIWSHFRQSQMAAKSGATTTTTTTNRAEPNGLSSSSSCVSVRDGQLGGPEVEAGPSKSRISVEADSKQEVEMQQTTSKRPTRATITIRRQYGSSEGAAAAMITCGPVSIKQGTQIAQNCDIKSGRREENRKQKEEEDEDDDEEKAIYAYHISLRGATRAAQQRKVEGAKSDYRKTGDIDPTSGLENPSRVERTEAEEASFQLNELRRVELDSFGEIFVPMKPAISKQLRAAKQLGSHIAPRSPVAAHRRRPPEVARLKSTNPFLTDSLDL